MEHGIVIDACSEIQELSSKDGSLLAIRGWKGHR